MNALCIFIILVLIVLVYKRPEFGILAVLILIGFGDAFDFFLPSIFKLGSVAIIFLIEIKHGFSYKYIKQGLLLFFMLVVVKETLGYMLIGSNTFYVTALYVYILILTITFVSLKELRKKGIDIWSHYQIYIVLGLIVQFIRVFVDYQFFGIKPYTIDDANADSYFQFGEVAFRPSSLMSPIVFAVELSIYIGVILVKKGINIYNLPILIWAIIGLMLTNSRSGMVVVLLLAAYWIIINRKLGTGIVFLMLVVTALFYFDYGDRLLTIIDFNNTTYDTRFNSMNTVFKQIESFDIIQLSFGEGYGAANYTNENGDIKYYVENFFVSIFINSGLFAFIILISFILYAIIKGLKSKNSHTILLLCLVLVNLVACSMLIYTVQILFWILTLSIIWDSKKIYKRCGINL